MIVMHKRNGSWEAFDCNDLIAVFLTPQDRVNIENMSDESRVYMAFPRDRGYGEDFLYEEIQRVTALGSAREKKARDV